MQFSKKKVLQTFEALTMLGISTHLSLLLFFANFLIPRSNFGGAVNVVS